MPSPLAAVANPAIESPCIKVCVIHPAQRLCLGCGRTLDEIACWIDLDAAERRRIMTLLPSRLTAMSPATATAKA